MGNDAARNFLATAISVNDNDVAVNGTDFDSLELVPDIGNFKELGAVSVWFTPATPAAVTIDFEYQASLDGGSTFSSMYFFRIQVDTNETQDTGVVRKVILLNLFGVTHLRLYRVKVNSGAGNCTLINTSIKTK